MNTLPDELLVKVFSYLPQSEKQLYRILQLVVDKKIINNKPIDYYIKRLIFHYKYSLRFKDINTLSPFSSLHHIEGLIDHYVPTFTNKPIYLQLQQPIKFSYIPDDEQWIEKYNNVKNRLTSLNIHLSDETFDKIKCQKQKQQQLDIFYIRPDEQSSINSNSPVYILVLPTLSLTNLIELKIEFLGDLLQTGFYPSAYTIDERTFENIHLSCPLLESLSIEHVILNTSNKYNEINKTTKHSRLESLSLHLDYYYVTKENMELYQNSALNMLVQLTLLKKIYYTGCHCVKFWPYYEFFQWLNLESNQLTHFGYNFPLTEYKCKELSKTYDTNLNYFDEIAALPIHCQFNYLNHVTSLSLVLDGATDLVFTFLLKNKNTTIVSTILEELNIEKSINCKTKYMYIYDWLDVFPNMSLFKVNGNSSVKDLDILDNNDITNKYNKNSPRIIKDENENNTYDELHQLIKKRKQQYHQQEYGTLNKMNDDDRNSNFSNYKLKSLKLTSIRIWFEAGFDILLKECHQLKILQLDQIAFISLKNHLNGIYFDLSHLYLELLEIRKLVFIPMNNLEKSEFTKYFIHESLIGTSRLIGTDGEYISVNQYCFNLKCKFINGIIHDF
ncbi:unnamed protein product [Cunninghamella blakesleeana]